MPAPFTPAQWVPVSSAARCPICGHDSWCGVDAVDGTVRCKRTPSDRSAHGADGEAWLHGGHGEAAAAVIAAAPAPVTDRPVVDWAAKHRANVVRIDPTLVAELADKLGIEAAALVDLGVGWNGHGCYTFPMRGVDGAICGLRTRNRETGEKKAAKYCTLGIIRREAPDDGLLLVGEGETDAAAALSKGLDAIGVPGAGQCAEAVAAWSRGRDIVIVADVDTGERNRGVGERGAEKIAAACARPGAAASVRIITPPAPHKDLRAWFNAGATRDDVLAAIAAAPTIASSSTTTATTVSPITAPTPTASITGPALALVSPRLENGLLSRRPPPRDYLLRSPDRADGQPAAPRHGEGAIPAGIVAMLASEGGIGKTYLLLLLAVCCITGRPWLGFHVDAEHVGQRVLLVLAEETLREVWRRLWAICEALGLPDDERRLVERQLWIYPMAGRPCAIADYTSAPAGPDGAGGGRELSTTDEFEVLANTLLGVTENAASPPKWSLVGLDPLARLAPDAETANPLATNAIQACERLVELSSGALVLVAHHSSKVARRAEAVDARGVSALTDAVRLLLTLNVTKDGHVRLVQEKSNYSAPRDPVVLVRDQDGVLRRATDAELQVATEATATNRASEVEADARLVVDAIRAKAAEGKSSNAQDIIATWARVQASRARKAVAYALSEKWIVQPAYRGPYLIAPDGPRDGGDGGTSGGDRAAGDQDSHTHKGVPKGRRDGSPRLLTQQDCRPASRSPGTVPDGGTSATLDDGRREQPTGASLEAVGSIGKHSEAGSSDSADQTPSLDAGRTKKGKRRAPRRRSSRTGTGGAP
jgi:RecA-family ATPase